MNTRQIAAEYRLSQWMEAIQERISSGETIKDFCKRKGVKRNTYFYWQQRIRKAACEKLSELQKTDPSTGISLPGFTEVKLPETPKLERRGEVHIEIHGIQIRAGKDYPKESLVALLREVSRLC